MAFEPEIRRVLRVDTQMMADVMRPGRPPVRRTRLLRVMRAAAIGALVICIITVALFVIDNARSVRATRELDRLIDALLGDPVLAEALRLQNAALAEKDEAWALGQDRAWRAERDRGGGPLQRAMMDRPESRRLAEVVGASDGLISHAFLIDAKGRMAAQPFPSFNFWQFDKPKFHYTFPVGAGARDVSWLQPSWDATHLVCWRAQTFVDPATSQPVGVLAVEVNYQKVGRYGCGEEPIHTAHERATNRVEP